MSVRIIAYGIAQILALLVSIACLYVYGMVDAQPRYLSLGILAGFADVYFTLRSIEYTYFRSKP